MQTDSAEIEQAFKQWLVEHHGSVLKVARAYTLTSEDCKDLAQEILLQVWRSLTGFQGRANATTWFYRVALNTAIGWHRGEQRRRGRRDLSVQVEAWPATQVDSSHQLIQNETIERLFAAIRQLPKTDAALVLLYLDDMSYQQMAEVLGMTEANVGTKLGRAKRALAELLKEV